MFNSFRHGALMATVSAFAIAGTAQADVTPQDVWAQWQSYMTTFGYRITSAPVEDGRNLRLPEFTMEMDFPTDPDAAPGAPAAGSFTISFSDIALIDRGDGTVSIEIPESMPVRMGGTTGTDDPFNMQGTITATGYSTIAAGTPDDITYTLAAAEIGLSVDQIVNTDNKTIEPAALMLRMLGAAGTTRIAADGDATVLDQTLTAQELTYDFDFKDPDGNPGHFIAAGALQSLTAQSTGRIPGSFDPLAVSQALSDGYAMTGTMSFGSGRTDMDFADAEQTGRLKSTSQGGDFTVAMSENGLVYDIASRGIDFSLEGSQIPFPIATQMGEFGLGIDVPVVAGEEEQDFTAGLTLADVAIPEPIWMMIDAEGALPHDPLTAVLETSGKVRLFADIFDEAQMAKIGETGERPGEVTQLSLDSLLLKAGGATAAATGAFDIDNTRKSPFNPQLPAFAGQLDLQLDGVTTLVGKLGQMGLIPAAQVMMVSGMIQQLGKPGSGPDSYTAQIGVTEDSQLTVNGAPIPLR